MFLFYLSLRKCKIHVPVNNVWKGGGGFSLKKIRQVESAVGFQSNLW